MKLIETDIPGVIVIEPRIYRDDRGFFLETYHRPKYVEAGIDAVFVQDNHSRSQRGTVRGLHAQILRPQGKLIRVIEGEIFDVAVDIRRGSPTFGKWVGAWLSAENFRQIYIPAGFAHGFCVTAGIAQVEYKCTDLYDPSGELCVQWNDPDLAIDWPMEEIGVPVLSKKDEAARPLSALMDSLPWYEQ
ncbi:MAG: dTDP-4-dehydrorhamnose 3,5-epimerase [Blastocatellia bacterium]